MSQQREVTFLVVGGGIAGVTCAETLVLLCPEASVLLLTESNVIKTVSDLQPIARYLHKFNVRETNSEELTFNIITLVDSLQFIDSVKQQVTTKKQNKIKYQFLCLCTGATAHLIAPDNPKVIGIRDTDSVLELQKRLALAKEVAVVGNGGIASELVHELQGVKVHWVVKDNHVASTFVDAGAAYFLLQKPQAATPATDERKASCITRWRYGEEQLEASTKQAGAALGPDWQKNFHLHGNCAQQDGKPIIHYKAQVAHLQEQDNAVELTLSTGEKLTCDFLISATGVQPRLDFSSDLPFELGTDGGLAVNEMMQTNLAGIYAAGDVCSANWPPAKHWFQMRLWTQARQMGAMAARSMAAAFENEQIYQDFCFELFGHVTELFGYSVVLLGRYNGQGLGNGYEILLRTTPGLEYIKFVLQAGRLRGALLIGNTELAETCENLILNEIDLTALGDDILNPDIDIEDYFD